MDNRELRKKFSVLDRKINGRPFVYFDNACMALKPDVVIKAISRYYYEFPGCAGLGRSNHFFSEKVDSEVYKTREKIRDFINARPCRDSYKAYTPTKEVVFTKNTTESINLVANSYPFGKDAVVLTTDREHSSNLCPWRELEKRGIIRHLWVPSKQDNTFDIEEYERILKQKNVELVSMVHVSNLDGYEIPAGDIIRLAHKYKARVLLDAAQSAPHIPIDVQELDVDFLAFSIHKLYGPTGIGVLYGKEEILNSLEFRPFITGGDTIEDLFLEKPPIYLDSPFRFEAGLQNYAGIVGTGAAIDFVKEIGMENIKQHVTELNKYLTSRLSDYQDEFFIIGPSDPNLRGSIITMCFKRMGIVSLFMEGINGIGNILSSRENIMVRSGEFCVHSWFNNRKISRECEKIRASFSFYNTKEECDIFADALGKIFQLEEYRMLPKL